MKGRLTVLSLLAVAALALVAVASGDVFKGTKGNDAIWVGSGADVENGGDGNDRMHALAADNQVDRVECGPGDDVAFENASEHDVFVNCEKVITRVVTPNQAAEDDQ